MKIEDIKNFMIQWNRKFPVDRWWREKHKVSFLSTEHRETSFLTQLIEFTEDVYFQEEKEVEERENYIPNIGDYLKDPITTLDLEEKECSNDFIELFRKEAKRINEIEKENGDK